MQLTNTILGRGIRRRPVGKRRDARVRLEALEDRIAPAGLPPGFAQIEVATGLSNPTTLQFGPEGELYVAEQWSGEIKVIRDGVIQPDPLIRLDVANQGERGLIGFTFDPGFASHGHDDGQDGGEHSHTNFLYVHYTVPGTPAHNRVSRFMMVDGAVAGPEQVLLEIDPLGPATIHNGGSIVFAPDGTLFIGVGDNSVGENAQSLESLHGKVLRINPDGTIPDDNPYVGILPGKYASIWASGLRNPFRLSIHPETGQVNIGDVGQWDWEEINLGVPGANYGWPDVEGPSEPGDLRFSDPIHAYSHTPGDPLIGCAVSASVYYLPEQPSFPAEYVGDLFYADYCNGIRILEEGTHEPRWFDREPNFVTDLAVGPGGDLYYVSLGDFRHDGTTFDNGAVYRITYTGSDEPVVSRPPADQIVSAGEPARFSVVPSGAPPYAFQWLRDGEPIMGATGDRYSIDATTPADDGAVFSVRITNEHGVVESEAATLTVVPYDRPEITFSAPTPESRYVAGVPFEFAAEAVAGDGTPLGPESFTWWMNFHHDEHYHPLMAPTGGMAEGSAVVPAVGETSDNVWVRIHVRVTDANGLTTEAEYDLHPVKAEVTLRGVPEGLGVVFDGTPTPMPLSFVGVAGVERTVTVPDTIDLGGTTWIFDTWSDGRPAVSSLATPRTDAVLTAVYRVDGGELGAGTGLRGLYLGPNRSEETAVQRVDPVVALGGPGAFEGIATARWTGRLLPQFDEPYTFQVRAEGGARLWIDGELVLETWGATGETTASSTPVPLDPEHPAEILLEYRRGLGDGGIDLLWSSPSTPLSIVPSRQTEPADPVPPGGIGPGRGPMTVDFDGDGTDDLVFYDPADASWTIELADGQRLTRQFGMAGVDVPVPADYDGDGRADLAVFRPESDLVPGAAHWLVALSGGGVINQPFGAAGMDLPAPGDYDGDGRADLAVFRPESDLVPGAAHWLVALSGGGVINQPFGAAGMDLPAPGDYDGDGRADLAVFRPESDLVPGAAHWLAALSGGGVINQPVEGAGRDLPAPGDYDGDGWADLAVFRPSESSASIFLSRIERARLASLDPMGPEAQPVTSPALTLWKKLRGRV
ncbi:PQQ-dependent sugar dehydrogenase [Tautonia marina]|uniref:PQQ-dependent sugar dehydrogenase n=1 Tax=Tautonia marina TaxID=2653855 RepID=UPI00137566F1|nr:PQQ-dependent sugar dehydrogenase [Tautonia marina]